MGAFTDIVLDVVQLVLVIGAIATAVLWVLARAGLDSTTTSLIAAVAVAVAVLGAFGYTALQRADARSLAALATAIPDPALDNVGRFTTSDRCAACHPGAYHTWHDSWHRTMTQPATPEAFMGDFDRVRLESRGVAYFLERRGDEIWVEMPDPDWAASLVARRIDPDAMPASRTKRRWKRVVMLTGSHRMQTAWVGSEHDGGLHNLPFIWLSDQGRWVPREDVFLRPPDAARQHATWHDNCIECHATAADPVPAKGPPWDPVAAELGIACEACHGPAEAHVAKYASPLSRWSAHGDEALDGDIVNPARLPAPASAQICGQCHGMHVFKGDAATAGKRYRAGGDLTETRMVLRSNPDHVLERELADWVRLQRHVGRQEDTYLRDRFWDDGMVRVSGREYNPMTASKCFEGGELSCISCHSMHGYEQPAHQMAPGRHGDGACLQCHAEVAADVSAHTHHPVGSSGSACLNCHMPRTVYGLMSAIRSHQVDAPSVESDLGPGRPNACSLCHLDRSLGWVQERLASWYGHAPRELSPEEAELAAGVRYVLTGDAGQRAIVAWHLGWDPARETSGADWTSLYLAHLLGDPYATVRKIAEDGLAKDEAFAEIVDAYDYVGPEARRLALRDRAVRSWVARWAGTGGLDRSGPELLIGADGTLDAARLSALAATRSERRMDLRE